MVVTSEAAAVTSRSPATPAARRRWASARDCRSIRRLSLAIGLSPLGGAKLHIVAADFGQQGDQHIAADLGLGLQVVTGLLDRPARASEYVDLPGGIEPGDQKVVVTGVGGEERAIGTIEVVAAAGA